MSPDDPWERLLVNNLARDIQQMRLTFLAFGLAEGRFYAGGDQNGSPILRPRIEQFPRAVRPRADDPEPNGAMLSHIRRAGTRGCRER